MPDLDLPAIRKALAEASEAVADRVRRELRCCHDGDCAAEGCDHVHVESCWKDVTYRQLMHTARAVEIIGHAEALLAEIERLRKVEAAARPCLDRLKRISATDDCDCFYGEHRCGRDAMRAEIAALDAALGGGA